MNISSDRKQVGERLLEFAIKINGGKKAGAKQLLADKLDVVPSSLSPYFKGFHIPGNLMQSRLRELGADTHYIITGEKLSHIKEQGVEYLRDNDEEAIYSIVHQLELRRDLARILNSSIEVLLTDLKKQKKIYSHPNLLARLISTYNTHNQEYESLDEAESIYAAEEIDTLVKKLMG